MSKMLQSPRAASTSGAGCYQAHLTVSPRLRLGQHAACSSRLGGALRRMALRAADQDIYGKLKDKLYMEAAAKRFVIGEQRSGSLLLQIVSCGSAP